MVTNEIMKFAGAWKHLDEKEIKEMKTTISNLRKKSTNELFRHIRTLKQ